MRAREVGVGVASRELGLVAQTLGNGAKAAAGGKLNAAGAKAVMPEEMELSRLRAEKARLKMHVKILKKATAYFAKDALRGTPGSTRSAATIHCPTCAAC